VEAERLAAVIARDADFLVEPNCQTVAGLWISADSVVRLPRAAPATRLGASVRLALAASRRGESNVTDWRTFPSGLLRSAGVWSWSALQRSAARCQVETGPTGIRVLLSRNGGTRGEGRGYHLLEELAIGIPTGASDEELVTAVLSAVAACL
jgi:hypothetical protein